MVRGQKCWFRECIFVTGLVAVYTLALPDRWSCYSGHHRDGNCRPYGRLLKSRAHYQPYRPEDLAGNFRSKYRQFSMRSKEGLKSHLTPILLLANNYLRLQIIKNRHLRVD